MAQHLKAILFPLSAAICALALVYKLAGLRQNRRDPALLALLVAFTGKGISFTLSTPAVSAGVDRASGVPNLGALGIHLCGGVLSSAAFIAAVVYWVYPREQAARKAKAWFAAAAILAIAMIALWWMVSRGAGRSTHFLLDNAHRAPVAAYSLLYVSAFATAMTEIVRLCLRYGPGAGAPWLRRGLTVTAIGAIACIVYCLNRAFAVVAVQLDLQPLDWEVITPVANTIGIACIASGLTMPSWGPRLSAAASWWQRYRDNWTLYPLWRDVCTAVPEIAMQPPRGAVLDRLLPADLNFRLYRRTIEIRDGWLALRPYLGVVGESAGGQAGDAAPGGRVKRSPAEEDAARLHAALRAKRAGVRIGEAATTPAVPVPSENYAGELTSLRQLALAYRRGQRTATPLGTGIGEPNTEGPPEAATSAPSNSRKGHSP